MIGINTMISTEAGRAAVVLALPDDRLEEVAGVEGLMYAIELLEAAPESLSES